MMQPPTPRISSRKQPRQARSLRLVSGILEAAAQVLARDGAHRFTTARVAERAGVSVGSLYQYFPTKEAILFRLQTEEWQRTAELMRSILADRNVSPFERLRSVVRAFFRSEREEAALRLALGDALPLFRDAPETLAQRKSGMRQVSAFMREAIPMASKQDRGRATDIIMMSLETVGKQASERAGSAAELERLASAMGDMFCAYLERLNRRGGRTGKR